MTEPTIPTGLAVRLAFALTAILIAYGARNGKTTATAAEPKAAPIAAPAAERQATQAPRPLEPLAMDLPQAK